VGVEAFAVIRDAMKGKGVVALGRIVLNKRERVIALEPFGKGILGTTLHYAYEVKRAEDYFDDIKDIKTQGEMLKLAEHILETKKADFDPTKFEDHYETALVDMLRKKQAGFKPPKGKEKPAAPTNVVNLMDALRKSIAGGRSAPKKGRKRIEGQREMLLPIAGKKPAAEAAKKTVRSSAGRKKAG
jgi:DNA end-binding protein Ku